MYQPPEVLEAIMPDGRAFGRIPLFLLGSGVSVSAVPETTTLLNQLHQQLRRSADTMGNPVAKEIAVRLASDAFRLSTDTAYQSRASASRFFGTLQDSEHFEIRKCWEQFTRVFVLGENGSSPIWQRPVSEFHKYVADHVVRQLPPAVVVSLNYDGLTARAISELAREERFVEAVSLPGRFFPCRILLEAQEIASFYCRGPIFDGLPQLHSLIKLRGDIFSAVCGTEGCAYQGRRTPIYELSGTDTRQPIERATLCLGCQRERRIEIDFPGRNVKEEEVYRGVHELYRYVVRRGGVVVACGVSGRWDPELIAFLRYCTLERHIPLYILDLADEPALLFGLHLASNVVEELVHTRKFDFRAFQRR
jgi:hypothetical protein